MHPLPHRYAVTAIADAQPDVRVESLGLAALRTAAPVEFGGSGGRWSPETLLVAAVADCYVLTFRGLAERHKLAWSSLTCDVVGTLDRVDRILRFTEFQVTARLKVPDAASRDEALRVLNRAEETCLITRSLNGTVRLDLTVEADQDARVGWSASDAAAAASG